MPDSSLYSFEIGPIRPPSEGGSHSLLLRITRNCPWSRCKFCYSTLYNREKFSLRPVEEIKHDIDTVKSISEQLRQPSLPGLPRNQSVISVSNWLNAGAHTVFLQDADSLVMPAAGLIEVIKYLKATFPSVERITSYARAATIYRKTPEELKSLREAGLNRLHVGLESGDDGVLEFIDKGVTSEKHIAAGKKAKAAGFEYSVYVMPGVGGAAMSQQHALNTARVLNEINPDYIRLRPFVPRAGTPLFDEYQSGRFKITSPHQRLRELQILIGALNVSARVCFDHLMNGWRTASGELLFSHDYEGYQFPQYQQLVLELIEEGLLVDESRHLDARDLTQAHL